MYVCGSDSQAITDTKLPAVAPAIPKQVIVANVGTLPGVLTTLSGSSLPVTSPIAADSLYLTFWYIEKFTVRTNVVLAKGARKPVDMQ